MEGQAFKVEYFSEWEGHGCVATRELAKHTLIHTEEPFLRGPEISRALELHDDGTLKSQLDDTAFMREKCGKAQADIDELWGLHDQYADRYEDPSEQRLYGIIRSNSFENEEMSYQKRLYLKTSRFNHSCTPNVGYDFDGWTIRLYTLRSVSKGETLCISYVDEVLYFFPRDRRRLYLRAALNFECACPTCTMEDDEKVGRSDEKRKRLKQIAIELKHRGVGSALYSNDFCLQANQTIDNLMKSAGVPTKDKPPRSGSLEQLRERARQRKLTKSVPHGQHDINLLKEYISILEEEEIDFDMLPIFKLAQQISSASEMECSPSTSEWSEVHRSLHLLAKGGALSQETRVGVFTQSLNLVDSLNESCANLG